MDKIDMIKLVVRSLTRSGVSAATATIVANNRAHHDNEAVDKYYQASAFAGGMAAGWMLGEKVADFAEEKVDEAAAWFNDNFKKN